MKEALFDVPWWLLILLLAVGTGLYWSGNNRLDRALKRLGIALLLLTAAWGIVSWTVETDQEKVDRQTRQFVQAVVDQNQTALVKLLHPKAAVVLWNRDDILKGARIYPKLYGLKSAHITSLAVEDHGSEMTVNFTVLSEHDSSAMPISTIMSTWQFDWLNTDKGWELKNISPIRIGSLDQAASGRQYFQRRPH